MVSHDFVEALRTRGKFPLEANGRTWSRWKGDSILILKGEGLESVVNAGCRSVYQKEMRADRNGTNILSVPRTKVSNGFFYMNPKMRTTEQVTRQEPISRGSKFFLNRIKSLSM